jgi:hypothetical protein
MNAAYVEVVATVRIRVALDDESKITEHNSLTEAAQEVVSDLIYSLPATKAEIESYDRVEVLEEGDFANPVKCPHCGGWYALRKDSGKRIERNASRRSATESGCAACA